MLEVLSSVRKILLQPGNLAIVLTTAVAISTRPKEDVRISFNFPHPRSRVSRRRESSMIFCFLDSIRSASPYLSLDVCWVIENVMDSMDLKYLIKYSLILWTASASWVLPSSRTVLPTKIADISISLGRETGTCYLLVPARSAKMLGWISNLILLMHALYLLGIRSLKAINACSFVSMVDDQAPLPTTQMFLE